MARTKPLPLPKPTALDPLPPNTQAILRPGIEAVAYHIPVALPSSTSSNLKSTIALPRYSRWTSGLHFHTGHTKYLRLIKGSIFVELNGELKILSAKAGGEVSSITGRVARKGLEIKIDRYARQNWGRAEEYLNSTLRRRRSASHRTISYPDDSHDEVIVEEWTDPADITKPLFFWNLNGVITAPDMIISSSQSLAKSVLRGWWIPFQLFVIFWDLDNWPVFLNLRRFSTPFLGDDLGTHLDHLIEYFITFAVLSVAKMLGKVTGTQSVSKQRTPDDLWQAYRNSLV
ncbi:Nn.00g045460.m01.CDS01 [Neocucurbitaria sp. VM-36]